ncbi:sugar nucleotide-binding protein [Sphingomonas montanisoli]|uniref:Sugar nucleotide-binding protein n=1 Tax=Sphingomonas montanisoli TaxID=2606412 RepID=A0A5D9C2P7_9SPHN|nr:sugar nucleotide-binding protein [Sphingomonas montanisoli]TZG25856.1 sugar nucleotide-binding protein [Sphingomonas montanisoli]
MKALIGHSGYVGTTLLGQQQFDTLFRSTNIGDLAGGSYDLAICTAAPAQRWIAERDPEADLANIDRLADAVTSIEADRFVLISTVDVYGVSAGMSETDEPAPAGAYGRNRLHLENRVRAHFPDALIVRLPGLVGPGLRKNAIFDFRNDNALHLIDARAVLQWYPMVNLSADIATAQAAGLKLVNFAVEPVSLAEVAKACGRDFDNQVEGKTPAHYDMRSNHAAVFGGTGPYLYTKRESLLAVRAYAQSEPTSAAIA